MTTYRDYARLQILVAELEAALRKIEDVTRGDSEVSDIHKIAQAALRCIKLEERSE